jgi:estrogen-related receptor beta like 1
VISVLVGLCDLVVERNYARWPRPKYLPDRYPEEPDVDEAAFAEAGGEGARGGLDGEPATDDDSDEEELAYVAGSGGSALAGGPDTPGADAGKTAEEIEETRAIESAVDAAEWKLELERVAPQLRVAAAADAKDWRSHLESAHKHQRQIARSFPDVKASLERVAADVASVLDKIETRERFVNDQMEPLTAEYRRERERLDDARARYNASSETVSDLTNELARVSERLEEVKATMANRGDDIADSTPLNNLKGSIEKLNGEVKLMEARVGVVRGTLLRLSLTKKDRAARGGGKENVGAVA